MVIEYVQYILFLFFLGEARQPKPVPHPISLSKLWKFLHRIGAKQGHGGQEIFAILASDLG